MTAVKIFPSILAADFRCLGQQVEAVEQAGADGVHLDVMDGRFVPNLTLGPFVVEAVRKSTALPLDVHLMIVEPERYLGDFARAGADILSVHQEACPHLHRTIQQIKQLGKRAGVVLNPSTPLSTLEEVLGDIDPQTAPRVVAAGATLLVAGSAVFRAPGGAAEGVRQLRASVEG